MRSTRFTVVGGLLAVLLVLSAAAAATGQARSERGAAPHAAKAATTVTLAGWASSPEETRAVRQHHRLVRALQQGHQRQLHADLGRLRRGHARAVRGTAPAGRLLRRLARRA